MGKSIKTGEKDILFSCVAIAQYYGILEFHIHVKFYLLVNNL